MVEFDGSDEGRMTVWFKGTADVAPQEVEVTVDQSELRETIESESEEIQEELEQIKETIEKTGGGGIIERTRIPWWVWILIILGGLLGVYAIVKREKKEEER